MATELNKIQQIVFRLRLRIRFYKVFINSNINSNLSEIDVYRPLFFFPSDVCACKLVYLAKILLMFQDETALFPWIVRWAVIL